MHPKSLKKGPKMGLLFGPEMAQKSQKSEPWAQSGAPSLQEGSPGTQNTQKSSKMSSKITRNSENLVTHNQENPGQKKTEMARWRVRAQRIGYTIDDREGEIHVYISADPSSGRACWTSVSEPPCLKPPTHQPINQPIQPANHQFTNPLCLVVTG